MRYVDLLRRVYQIAKDEQDNSLEEVKKLSSSVADTLDMTTRLLEEQDSNNTNTKAMVLSFVKAVNGMLHWDNIRGKPVTFTPSPHKHDYNELTNKPELTWKRIEYKPTKYAPTKHSLLGNDHILPILRDKEVFIGEDGNITIRHLKIEDIDGLEEELKQKVQQQIVYNNAGSGGGKVKLTDSVSTVNTLKNLTVPEHSIAESDSVSATLNYESYVSQNVSSDTTVEKNGYYIIDSTSGEITMTVPDACECIAGTYYSFHFDKGNNAIRIVTESGLDIDGDTEQILRSAGQNLSIRSDGDNWHIVQDSRNNAGSGLIYYSTETADGTIVGYNLFANEPPSDSSISDTITTSAQLIVTEITPENTPAITTLSGTLRVFEYLQKTSGSGDAAFYAEIYKRDTLGTETLLVTTDTQTFNSSDITLIQLEGFVDTTLDITDRIVVKYYANRNAGGSDPTYSLYIGATYPSRLELPISGLPSNVMLTNTYDTDNDGVIDTDALPSASSSSDGIVPTTSGQSTGDKLRVKADLTLEWYTPAIDDEKVSELYDASSNVVVDVNGSSGVDIGSPSTSASADGLAVEGDITSDGDMFVGGDAAGLSYRTNYYGYGNIVRESFDGSSFEWSTDWATDGKFDGTPAVVTFTDSMLRLNNSSVGNQEFFRYKTVSGTVSFITLAARVVLGSKGVVGVRLDSGASNDYIEFFCYRDASSGFGIQIGYRYVTNGGTETETIGTDIFSAGAYNLELRTNAGGVASLFYSTDTVGVVVSSLFVDLDNWSSVPSRAGILYENDENFFNSYIDWIALGGLS